MSVVQYRCDLCPAWVLATPIDTPDEHYALINHKWAEHGILGVTRCEHCGMPLKTSALADHVAIEHDLPSDAPDTERLRRELVRLRQAMRDSAERDSEAASRFPLRDSDSQLARAARDIRREAMWLVGAAAVGYLIHGFRGAAVTALVVLVLIGFFSRNVPP
jgi:F0F1-type ATP synthase assembly protein I